MTKIQFRYKVIKFLGKVKIDIRISLRLKLKLSKWILSFVSLFIRFEERKIIEPPGIIEHDSEGEDDD